MNLNEDDEGDSSGDDEGAEGETNIEFQREKHDDDRDYDEPELEEYQKSSEGEFGLRSNAYAVDEKAECSSGRPAGHRLSSRSCMQPRVHHPVSLLRRYGTRERIQHTYIHTYTHTYIRTHMRAYVCNFAINTEDEGIDEDELAPTLEELRPKDPQTSESEANNSSSQHLASRIKNKELKMQKKLRANVSLLI